MEHGQIEALRIPRRDNPAALARRGNVIWVLAVGSVAGRKTSNHEDFILAWRPQLLQEVEGIATRMEARRAARPAMAKDHTAMVDPAVKASPTHCAHRIQSRHSQDKFFALSGNIVGHRATQQPWTKSPPRT